jgi:hypothetical protein
MISCRVCASTALFHPCNTVAVECCVLVLVHLICTRGDLHAGEQLASGPRGGQAVALHGAVVTEMAALPEWDFTTIWSNGRVWWIWTWINRPRCMLLCRCSVQQPRHTATRHTVHNADTLQPSNDSSSFPIRWTMVEPIRFAILFSVRTGRNASLQLRAYL